MRSIGQTCEIDEDEGQLEGTPCGFSLGTWIAARTGVALTSGAREVPYSLVTAIDLSTIVRVPDLPGSSAPPPIVVNDWTARDLDVKLGDPLTLAYYVWEEPGRLLTRNLMIYGLGGIIAPFVGIKLIDLIISTIGLA